MASERTMTTRWKSVVDPSVKRAADEVTGESEKSSGKMTAIWAGVGSAIGTKIADGLTWAAGQMKDFVTDSFRAASDLKESVNVVELAFGDQAKSLDRFFKSAASSVGMAESAAREAAAGVGGLLGNMGMTESESARWSKTLLTLSADMGSAFNSDPADAIAAIGAGLRGESEPLRRYNVMLSDAKLKSKAMELGLYSGKGALEDNARAQSALALIMEQTSKIQGDFANTSTGAANAARIQEAKIEDLKAKFGEQLLPAQEAVLAFMNDKLIPGLSVFAERVGDGIRWVQDNAEELKVWGTTLGVVAAGLAAVVLQQKIMAAGSAAKWIVQIVQSTKLWAIAQGALNFVMTMNPIGIVIMAITALVAGIVLAYQKSETFRKIVDTAFQGIAAAGRWLWNNALAPVIKFIVDGFAWAAEGVWALLAMLGDVPGFEWARDAANGLRQVADNARAASDQIRQIPEPSLSTEQARSEVSSLQEKINSLKGKQVEAKARGDAREVKELQAEINKLRDKQVKIKLNAVLQSRRTVGTVKVGNQYINVGLIGAANGALFAGGLRRFAAGGVENHVAQIAPAGAMRLWAEPETGGEAYIPLSPSKRPRSREIWAETGRLLGVLPNADGQVYSGSSAAGDSSDLAAAINRLADRVLSREDMEQLLDELRRAQSDPRPVAGVRLG